MSGFFNPNLLKGRRFLITGATGGAGSRTAIEISRCGGVCLLQVRDVEKGEKVLRELHGAGHGITPAKFEGAEPPFDGIFHAAGHEHIGSLSGETTTQQAAVFDPSLGIGLDLLRLSALKKNGILKDGGSIVFMSSVAAIRGQNGMSLYCASKGAIESLVRAAAVELAPRRIRVNAIRAGAFDSPMHRRITQRATPDAIDDYARKHLLGFGRSEDIANAALFLLSDAARWITGTCMDVDGGYGAK